MLNFIKLKVTIILKSDAYWILICRCRSRKRRNQAFKTANLLLSRYIFNFFIFCLYLFTLFSLLLKDFLFQIQLDLCLVLVHNKKWNHQIICFQIRVLLNHYMVLVKEKNEKFFLIFIIHTIYIYKHKIFFFFTKEVFFILFSIETKSDLKKKATNIFLYIY